jgi:hypothetical protein
LFQCPALNLMRSSRFVCPCPRGRARASGGFSYSVCKDGSLKVREEVYAAFRAGDIRILRIEREARRRIAEEARLAQEQAEEALILAKMAEIKTETAIKQRMEELAVLF